MLHDSIFSSLVDDVTEDDRDIKSRIHEIVDFCHRALQHLLYIEDEFEIAREDLKQRINITLASLHLKSADPKYSPPSSSPDNELDEATKLVDEKEESLHLKSANPNHSSSSDTEIVKAMILIGETEKSLMKLRGTERLTFNSCCQLLVKSDLYFHKYQSELSGGRIKHIKESCKYVEEAQNLAEDNIFEEIEKLCEKRKQNLKVHSEKVKKDEVEEVETIVDELLS